MPTHPSFIPTQPLKVSLRHLFYFLFGILLGTIVLGITILASFEQKYKDRVIPGVSIASIPFSGYTSEDITDYWSKRNAPLTTSSFTLEFENHVATLSGQELGLGFDASLSASQALSIGRTGHLLTDISNRLIIWKNGLDFKPLLSWHEDVLDKTLATLAQVIDIEPENALFEFQSGRVSAFKTAKVGRFLDSSSVKQRFVTELEKLATTDTPTAITFKLPVLPKEPEINNEQANNLGIVELLGKGESYFRGSIPGRVYNVALAASRINGVLIAPTTTFSFNATVGDISARSGYKQAYVIKSGRTVLDDGGGVCQVSTTLFRAALNSGLPIVERWAHSYRVGYYEQGGWKPGFDATVYAPSYDLKILNDTPAHILIQAIVDTAHTKLTFELYGRRDGRTVEISSARLWDSRPAPPDLYQDDPTLPVGTVKQVDWANPGIKSAFDYTVTRDGVDLFKKTFFSNFIPWQAIYLRGTKT